MMKRTLIAIWKWVAANPHAATGYTTAMVMGFFGIYLQASGRNEEMDSWNKVVGQLIDSVINIITLLAAVAGAAHHAAGPTITASDVHTAVGVAVSTQSTPAQSVDTTTSIAVTGETEAESEKPA